MKASNRFTLLACALMLPTLVQANDSPLAQTLKTFAGCDGAFFSALQSHAGAWQAHAPLRQEQGTTFIAVPERASKSGNQVALQGNPQVAGMELLAYFDEMIDLGNMGRYLFWGFIVDGEAAEVARQFGDLMDHPEQLKAVGQTHVRSELRIDGNWRLVEPVAGAPGVTRVERVLLIEPERSQPGRTRVACSLQGAVDGQLLAEVRPDIPARQYPREQPDADIASVEVEARLTQQLDLPLLQPKFSSLQYTYTSSGDKAGSPRPVTVTLRAENGLLDKTESYSESFRVERLTKADLVQLKAKMNGVGDSRVLVARELELQVPSSWEPGQVLSARAQMQNVPVVPGEEASEVLTSCTVGERFAASEIFASLTGQAVTLQCVQGSYRTTRAFIEELGFAVVMRSWSSDKESIYRISDLQWQP